MIEYVPFDLAKLWLRVDTDDLDPAIRIAILAASGLCANYLKSAAVWEKTEDVPPPVQAATLIMLGTLFRDPDGADAANWQQGFLPFPVMNLLYPLRDPALS